MREVNLFWTFCSDFQDRLYGWLYDCVKWRLRKPAHVLDEFRNRTTLSWTPWVVFPFPLLDIVVSTVSLSKSKFRVESEAESGRRFKSQGKFRSRGLLCADIGGDHFYIESQLEVQGQALSKSKSR